MAFVDKKPKDGNSEWVAIPTSKKKLTRNDKYILGHPEIEMPAIMSTSTVAGVRARLVQATKTTVSNTLEEAKAAPKVKVITEWVFKRDNESMPIFFDSPKHIYSDVWVEVLNPTDRNASVTALIHGMITSNKR